MAEQEIGAVTHYFDKMSVAAIRLTSGTLRRGDPIRIQGHSTDFEQVVSSIQIEHLSVTEAKQGDEIGIKVSKPVHEHDKVFKLEGRGAKRHPTQLGNEDPASG
jgi:translation initiation factor IF-2